MNRRSLTALALAAVASVTVVTGCSSSTTEAPGSAAVAASAPALGAELDPAGFASAMKRPGTVVLDVRTPAEFAEGHLPGAVNIDVSAADFASRVAALDKSAPYAVYCRSGNRSAAALEVMKGQGFTGAYHLGGGITAWKSAGGEVVTG
jgi:rhodanese-related sulfurtransferase